MSNRRKLIIGVGAAAVIALAAGIYGIWWFLKDDAPDEVALEDAVAAVAGDAGDAGDPTSTVDSVAGSWAVDTSIGSFDFETATGSFAGFRVEEELSSIGSTTAVGRTGAVSGELTIEGSQLTATQITVDLSQLTTNDSRRDGKAKGALNTGEFPNANFVLGSPIDLGAAVDDGSPVSVDAAGDLTIKGVTQRVTFTIDAQLVGDVIAVVGSTEIVWADFGVEVPTAPIVVSAEDRGVVEFQLLFGKV